MNDLIKQMLGKLADLQSDLDTLSGQVTDEQWDNFELDSIHSTFSLTKDNLEGLLEVIEEAQKEGGDRPAGENNG